MELVYDPTIKKNAFALVRTTCCGKTMFAPGNESASGCHMENCPELNSGKKNLVLVITPAFVAHLLERAKIFGDNDTTSGVSINMLRKELPEALENLPS